MLFNRQLCIETLQEEKYHTTHPTSVFYITIFKNNSLSPSPLTYRSLLNNIYSDKRFCLRTRWDFHELFK